MEYNGEIQHLRHSETQYIEIKFTVYYYYYYHHITVCIQIFDDIMTTVSYGLILLWTTALSQGHRLFSGVESILILVLFQETVSQTIALSQLLCEQSELIPKFQYSGIHFISIHI